MSLPMPADLWRQLCAFLAQHETCAVTLWQHKWQITKMELGGVVIRPGDGSQAPCIQHEGKENSYEPAGTPQRY